MHKLSTFCNNIINKFIGCCVKYVGKDMIFLYYWVYIICLHCTWLCSLLGRNLMEGGGVGGEMSALSPKSDQHQFFPNNINTQSREKIRRINKMIT